MRTINGKVTWIDLVKPTRADVDDLKKLNQFHPVILDELLHLSSRSRVETYQSYLFLTYHLPMYDPVLKTSRRAEVDFLITDQYVITVRYEDLEPMDNFFQLVSANPDFKDLTMSHDTGRLTYYLIQNIIDFSMRQLNHIQGNLSHITREIFAGRENEMLERISYVKRDILDYAIISQPQEILLNSLVDVGKDFWGVKAEIYLKDLAGDYLKVTQNLENYRQVIESLETTNGQLLSSKTNRVMQLFTILAFLTFPIFFITAVLQVDYFANLMTFLPPYTPALLLGLVVVAIVILVVFFKKKKWL